MPHDEAEDGHRPDFPPARNAAHPVNPKGPHRYHLPFVDGSIQGHAPHHPARQQEQPHQPRRRLVKSSDVGGGSNTDEERADRDFHLRKMFLKGQRVHPLDQVRTIKRSDASETSRAEGRQAELRHLESALARESAFRESQAEAKRRSQLEAETKERIRQVEGEIYHERSQ